MPDSQNPEHVRKIIREFQLKGGNLIPTVTAEIVPTVVVADLSIEARAEDRYATAGVQGAASGAGNQNTFSLSNPAGSGAVVIVDEFWIRGAAIDNISLELTTGDAGGGASFWRDGRLLGEPVSKLIRVAAAAAALTAIQFNTATVSVPLGIHWVLLPNQRIKARQDAQNTAMDLYFNFRERDLSPGE